MRHFFSPSTLDIRYSAKDIESSKEHVYSVELDGAQFRGVVPAPMAEDFGYAFATAAEAWSWLSQAREMHPDGKRWQVLESQKGDCAKALYTLLADVPVNDNDELETDFLHFDSGTPRYDVWHWLEHEYGVAVADL